ncbi:hypothetical protein LJC18_03015 [Lachnospiraceae bacterium OttesenSCG-928-E19]|nr:hypothetical protein [Lachnospiraceae bacterium OttesenSCG-928-E19]
MAEKSGYAVIKFVSNNGQCKKGSDYIEGQLLVEYLRGKVEISKEQLFEWLKQMSKLIEQYHQCGSNYFYRYVTPYMFLVTTDEQIVLLDQRDRSNQKIVQQMQKEIIRTKFLPPEEPYFKRGSAELDIYGMGRMIQYMLAQIIPEPGLSKLEIVRFQMIIRKCLKYNSEKQYSDVSRILRSYPTLRERKKVIGNQTPTLRIALALVAVLMGIFIMFSDSTKASAEEVNVEEVREL